MAHDYTELATGLLNEFNALEEGDREFRNNTGDGNMPFTACSDGSVELGHGDGAWWDFNVDEATTVEDLASDIKDAFAFLAEAEDTETECRA